MNRKDLISKITDVLRENDTRKSVAASKTVFHIADDYGNKKDFTIHKSSKGLIYNFADVENIISACAAVIERAVQNGEEISIPGFGSLNVIKRAEHRTKHPVTGKSVTIDARYIPKFNPGKYLKMAARVYEESLPAESLVVNTAEAESDNGA